ncbi:MAG: phosphate ABC transporter permease PstA [Thiohalomonadales bacterium]|nr:phosphate ABC transporter permease PstA [Thiohalomonadales bacterium]
MRDRTAKWLKSGTPWIWLNAGAVSVSLLMVLGLLLLITVRGLSYFWPSDVLDAQYKEANGSVIRLIGAIDSTETITAARARDNGYKVDSEEPVERDLLKVGNRDVYGSDFKLVLPQFLTDIKYPTDMLVAERREWGNFYGFLKSVSENGTVIAEGEAARQVLTERLQRAVDLYSQIRSIQVHEIGSINYQLEHLRLKQRSLELDGVKDPAAYEAIENERKKLQEEYDIQRGKMTELFQQIRRDSMTVETMNGTQKEIPLAKVVRVYYPNAMGLFAKFGFYFEKIWEFVSEEPREANTEGGIFPAIFGTVMMVLIMAVLVTPFGVIAAVYLREYAKQGPIIRIIRIAVNNLAGVPSIVYGVFGLGFFVYFLGGNIDALFFPEAKPAPTFGTPGILWASLTLALLTLPVVIVATEEGLARIPRALREGSLALGATKAETLWRIVIPMASPAMMTGLILAVARAAGEVAPLMLVGVVKLAPSLPLDGNFPYLHLERKFMHLGFHIYDVGFQSPNVEAARPLVYATSLLLIIVIVMLNLTAIYIRNHLREKYRSLEH